MIFIYIQEYLGTNTLRQTKQLLLYLECHKLLDTFQLLDLDL